MRPDRPAQPARSPRSAVSTRHGRRGVGRFTSPARRAVPMAAVALVVAATTVLATPAAAAPRAAAPPATATTVLQTPPTAWGTPVPVVNCVQYGSDGTYRAVFGYTNPGSQTIKVPAGLFNFTMPGDYDTGQPTTFEPGTHEGVFATSFHPRSHWLSWIVLGSYAVAGPWSTRCGPDVTLPTEGNGMGPVIVLVVSTMLSVGAAALHHRRRTRTSAPESERPLAKV